VRTSTNVSGSFRMSILAVCLGPMKVSGRWWRWGWGGSPRRITTGFATQTTAVPTRKPPGHRCTSSDPVGGRKLSDDSLVTAGFVCRERHRYRDVHPTFTDLRAIQIKQRIPALGQASSYLNSIPTIAGGCCPIRFDLPEKRSRVASSHETPDSTLWRRSAHRSSQAARLEHLSP
jgi:hypothetical protein